MASPRTIKIAEFFPISAEFRDAQNNVTDAPSGVQWTTSNPAVATIDRNDPATLRVVGTGVGTATITVTAGALTDSLVVNVVVGAPASVTIVAGPTGA